MQTHCESRGVEKIYKFRTSNGGEQIWLGNFCAVRVRMPCLSMVVRGYFEGNSSGEARGTRGGSQQAMKHYYMLRCKTIGLVLLLNWNCDVIIIIVTIE